MEVVNKLTTEQKTRLDLLTNDKLELVSTLGDLNYQKIVLDIQIEEIKSKIKVLQLKEVEFFDELQQLYGNIVLNLETGEYKQRLQ